MAQNVLIWTCVFVFVSTSIITVLGIINKISIDKAYLNKLFIALILEIVTIGILVFKDSFNPPNSNNCTANFVKITMPEQGFTFFPGENKSMYIKGAFIKSPESVLEGKLKINDIDIELTNTSSASNIFNYQITNKTITKKGDALILVSILNGKKNITRDSVHVKIK